MAYLTDVIEIHTTPEKIFNALARVLSSSEEYGKWHQDHLRCKWIKGNLFTEGSILYSEEYLHGKLHRFKIRLTKIEPFKKVNFRFLFPLAIICPKGSFTIEPKGEACVFKATLDFNFGRLLPKIFPNRLRAVETHMKEEGEYLKILLENDV